MVNDFILNIEMRITELFPPSAVIDGAALILLISVMIYTNTYRKRGHREDRIFCAMNILGIAGALVSIFNAVFGRLNLGHELVYTPWLMAGNTCIIFLLSTIGYMYVFYADSAYGGAKLSKYRVPLTIPLAVLFVMLMINVFNGFMFTISSETGDLKLGRFWAVEYVAGLLYILGSGFIMWKASRRFVILTFVFFVIRGVLMSTNFYWISSIPFMVGVILVFAHICMMNYTFYDEETPVDEPEKYGKRN